MGVNYLHWADYVVWSISLAISVAFGALSAWKHRKAGSLDEYILGKRSMNPALVSVSLIASLVDATLVMLQPLEVYLFGTVLVLNTIGMCLAVIISVYIVIPTFRKMKLASAYEYIERRFFSRFLRMAASLMYAIFILFQSGLTLYVPAIAFTQVTGFGLWVSIIICGSTCIIYTAMGGFRAVIWVDCLQMVVMLGGMVVFIILGAIQAGGGALVFGNARSAGRFNFHAFTLDPRVRYTIWSGVIGQIFQTCTTVCAGQISVQRFLSVKDDKNIRRMGFLSAGLAFILTSLATIHGVVLFGYYYGCDPITSGIVAAPEQLVPHFMIDLVGSLPGLPGLYMSALFAAAMSTLSSAINAICALAVKDFVQPILKIKWKRELGAREAKYLCTALSVILGVISVGAAFLPIIMGGLIIEINRVITVGAVVPILTTFLLGIFIPWANIWGAYFGCITSVAVGLWLGIGNQLYGNASKIPLPLSTDGCEAKISNYTSTTLAYITEDVYNQTTTLLALATTEFSQDESESFFQPMYDVSFNWLPMYTVVPGFIVGAVVSFLASGCSFARPSDVSASMVFDYKDCCRCFTSHKERDNTISESVYSDKFSKETSSNHHDDWKADKDEKSSEESMTEKYQSYHRTQGCVNRSFETTTF